MMSTSREPCHRASPPVRRLAVAVPLAFAAWLVTGCEPAPESKLTQPLQLPPPSHPAMTEAVAGRASPSSSPHGGSGQLPAGHPPVSAGAGAPGATPPPAGTASPPSAAPPAVAMADGPIELAGLRFELPEGLVREPPANQMRLVQARLPAAEGDAEDGLLYIMTAGGSVEGNVTRWRGQFEGNPEADTASYDLGGSSQVTTVRIEGTFQGMGGPATGGGTAEAAYRLWGAIVPRDGGPSLFFKATGPRETLRRWEEALEGMARSIQLTGS